MTTEEPRSGAGRDVLVVVYDDVQSLDVTGPVEVFVGAGYVAGVGSGGGSGGGGGSGDRGAYRVRTASVGGRAVRTSSGLTLLPDLALEDAPVPHTLIVPGGHGTREEQPELVAWLREFGARPERLVSVCTGALLLADAGLLGGRRVTTHWAYSAKLARDHPDIDVDPDPIYVRDGHIATSAGVTAGIDLALALVEEDLGRDVALTVARHLVVFLRRPGNQAQFSAQLAAQTARREPLREVQRWISEHPDGDLSVPALAERARLSPRHFARAFHAETGVPPGRYVDRVRLEHARRLLEDTRDSVEEVSRASGYGTPEAMRRAFVKALGSAPAEYRRRFRAAGASPAPVPVSSSRCLEKPLCRPPSSSTTSSRRSTPSGPTRP
ncbi:GlxA family transcriptional regulator [Streptomyces sp. TRM64462]|uniref:GlxA family transcriptional regulator n=1 Tax=Streptomyces sp. TRM64462 TaxID=2741726 RepID=UPI00158696F4|nr:DJ-1/PfpI family protein [Streptomyces sp. TRM64462]